MKTDIGQLDPACRMSTTTEPHLACHHSGYEFDWWRCNEAGYVGRPPSPFPASFDRAHVYKPDSADPRGTTFNDAKGETNVGINGIAVDGNTCTCGPTNGGCPSCNSDGTNFRRLYWPICQGPGETEPVQTEQFGNIDTSGLTNKGNKTPRLAHKRPPWIPTKMPNKWGVAGHPPPYTNYCRETLFNTRAANPSKVVIKTTF